MISFSSFGSNPNITFAISKRSDGGMKITGNASDDQVALARRQEFLQPLAIQNSQVVSAGLVHGSQVELVNHNHAGQVVKNTDGLITNSKNIALAVTVADCLPIVLYDPEHQAVGLLHAGWRGLAAGIIENAITKMADHFDTKPEQLQVAIGPSIHQCHYQVGSDLLDVFANEKITQVALKKVGDDSFLDLPVVAEQQLLAFGIQPNKIDISPLCTACHANTFFSFRKDGQKNGAPISAMMVVAKLS